MNLDEIETYYSETLKQLANEVEIVYRSQVLPNWGSGESHGFPRTLYAYIMLCMANVDLLSSYKYGTHSQTERMRRLLVDYFSATDEAAAICIKVWRHTLMHTSEPRNITSATTGELNRFLLHWGTDHLPRDQHLRLQEGAPVLGIALIPLIEQLIEASKKVFSEARASKRHESVILRTHEHLNNQILG